MLHVVWLGMLILGFALLLLSLVLAYIFNIFELADELSGRKAKRQIKKLREMNVGTGGLEGVSTRDVYSSATSGSLMSISNILENEEPSMSIESGDVSDDSEDIGTNYMQNNEVKKESGEIDDPETSYLQEDDIGTSDLVEVGTTYIREDLCGEGLSDKPKYGRIKKGIFIIEEQTSLGGD